MVSDFRLSAGGRTTYELLSIITSWESYQNDQIARWSRGTALGARGGRARAVSDRLELAAGVKLPAGGFPQELSVLICRVYIRIALTSVSESGLTL